MWYSTPSCHHSRGRGTSVMASESSRESFDERGNGGSPTTRNTTVAHQSRPGRGSEVPRGAERLMGGGVLPTHAEGSCTWDRPAFTPTTGSEFAGSSFVTYLQRLSRPGPAPFLGSHHPGYGIALSRWLPSQNFSYDFLNRMTSRWGKQSSVVIDQENFSYDPAGDMTAANDALNSSLNLTLGYDHANRLTSTTQGSATTSYGFTDDQLTSLTDPAGATSYTYRAGDGMIASLTSPYSGTAVPYGYDSSGRQTSRQDPDGLTTTRTLDYANRITSQSTAP